jgi:hypothetical protein
MGEIEEREICLFLKCQKYPSIKESKYNYVLYNLINLIDLN